MKRAAFAVLALLVCCDDPSISLPKKPIDGYCKPGVTFHCACPGDDPSVGTSGRETCGENFKVGPCDCDAGDPE